jgi:tyrosyl-tRNA synthetase
MLTFLPLEEIDAMDSWEGAQLNRAKEILAYELTKLVHGEEEAQKAEASAKALFGNGAGADVPQTELSESDFVCGELDICSLLVVSGLVATKSEARRAVEQGGVAVDDVKITNVRESFKYADLKDGKLFRRGKKAFRKIIAK